MDIRILPGNIANMIAAGEVVQRPASVVKELMENAVDAGAGQVEVVVSDAGRTLIQVIDNGRGMAPDDAVLCFERHATSKIATAEDLQDILTFGFRGEALASIAAVAEVTLRTRAAGAQLGCAVEFAGSKLLSTREVACPEGCNVEVRNLFYNVPARRKFLKSDSVEFRHIIEEFTRVALTRPETAFSLSHGGRSVYNLRPAKSRKYRILDLMGASTTDDLVEISSKTTVLGIEGFIGRPDVAKKALGNQFFFVNGRYFRSPYLHKAVMKAYDNLIPEGTTPAYFLYLTVDPRAVDVNIHPAKTEVKFEDDSMIFQVLYACVREAIGRNSFGNNIDFDLADTPRMPVFGTKYDDFRPTVARPEVSRSDFNPFEAGPPQVESASAPAQGQYNPGRYVEHGQDYGKLFEDKMLPAAPVIVLKNKYVLTQVASGVLVVNIRRARERILYERFLGAITKNGHISQTALFPVTVDIGVAAVPLVEDNRSLLESLGFDIVPIGKGSVSVNGMPEGMSCEETSVQATVADILTVLSEEKSTLPGLLESRIAERFARIGAAWGPRMTSATEAQRLIDTLFGCENSEFTSKGQRIMTILTEDEIEKKF